MFQQIDYPKGAKTIVLRYVHDIISIKESSGHACAFSNEAKMMIGWERPRFGYVKLNTDGCSKSNTSQVSAGDILRDDSGSGFFVTV